MGYDNFILIVNSVLVVYLSIMGLLICSAARFKGENSFISLILILTSIPAYTYDLCCQMEWRNATSFLAPICASINLSLIPLLWLLIQNSVRPHHRFIPIYLLHFILAFFSLLFYTCLHDVNILILSTQLLVYSIFTFRKYSNANIKDYRILFYAIMVISLIIKIIYSIFEFGADLWINLVLYIIVIYNLLYTELKKAFTSQHNYNAIIVSSDSDNEPIPSKTPSKNKNIEILEFYARQIDEYLQKTEAYLNSDISIIDVANATGIYSKNLSQAINIVLKKNFFDLINGYRIQKSMKLLLTKKEKGLTIETIAELCGFNSRFTFNSAFKKATGMTTSQWLKKQQQ